MTIPDAPIVNVLGVIKNPFGSIVPELTASVDVDTLPPRRSVPPAPLIVMVVAVTGPFSCATPPVFDNVTVPVVENPSMLCADVPGPIVIAADPPVNVPLFEKLPPRVRAKFPVASVAPAVMASGIEALNTLAAFIVTVPAFVTVTPPVAAKGVIHSDPVVNGEVVLYSNPAVVPYVSVFPFKFSEAVPCMDKRPLTVILPPSAFALEPESVRLLYGLTALTVCPAP